MPGLADRIITRFERQSEHRMELEKYVTRTNALRANLGLAAGLIVSLAGLGAGKADARPQKRQPKQCTRQHERGILGKHLRMCQASGG